MGSVNKHRLSLNIFQRRHSVMYKVKVYLFVYRHTLYIYSIKFYLALLLYVQKDLIFNILFLASKTKAVQML